MTRNKTPAAAPAPLPPKDPNPLDDRLIGYRLLNCRNVTELTGLTRRQRAKLEKRREFPLPIRVTQKIRLYPARSVLAWIEERETKAAP